MVNRPAIVCLSASGLETAQRIAAVSGGCDIHGRQGRCDGQAVSFDDTIVHLQGLFVEGRPIVGICAAGILVRALGPVLSDKRSEPPVIAVADDGSAVVPLLGGHRGANRLAGEIADLLGVSAALTTAGDTRFGTALDDPPAGWRLANPTDAKHVMAGLLAGEGVDIRGDAPWLDGLTVSDDAALQIVVTDSALPGSATRLVYHPVTLALGIGCERHCPAEEVADLVDEVLAEHSLSPHAIALVGSIDLKADEAAVNAVAARLGVPLRVFAADTLNEVADRLENPSDLVMREVGCPGVAEGAALVAAGPDAELIVAKTKSKRATCAIARATVPIDARSVGRARGRLSVVGLGPGSRDWRSPEASRLLSEASDWVGYGLYLDLAEDLNRGKTEHRFDLGQEEARVRHALELAGKGKDVALICSGDAGIYAMAALVYELLDEPTHGHPVSPAARRAEVVIAPGISAFQAAAARAGAAIGHDFCAISLSDLLTPWEVIETRLHAAAEGDFVIAFYNPRSMRRIDQLVRAIEILSKHRPPETPVIIASDIGRPKENIRVVALRDLDPAEVDMLTLVLVGASTTRMLETGDGRQWVYTPRGYEKKRAKAS